jgi:uncharacterized protein YbjT (DUF2867 family)
MNEMTLMLSRNIQQTHKLRLHTSQEIDMYAITGITGQVGGVVGRTLRKAGKEVRAVVRDAAKGAAWEKEGCEVALADMEDAASLKKAFAGTEGVFILLPPTFDPSPGFTEARRVIAAVREALDDARPSKVVCLSTVGAHASQTNLLQQLQLLEQGLASLPVPVSFLRAAWFIDNAAWDVAPARSGVIPSFLQPLDRPLPMVAAADVGRTAAELLQEQWDGHRVVELEGPRRISPDDLAAGFARLLGREVRAEAVPRESWEALFRAQGMKNPTPRIQMLDGFNDGWIAFEGGRAEARKGTVSLEAVLQGLIARSA